MFLFRDTSKFSGGRGSCCHPKTSELSHILGLHKHLWWALAFSKELKSEYHIMRAFNMPAASYQELLGRYGRYDLKVVWWFALKVFTTHAGHDYSEG